MRALFSWLLSSPCLALLFVPGASAQRGAPREVRTSAPLLVASPAQGIVEVNPVTGRTTRVLASTPASVGRLRDAQHVLFLVHRTNELRELDLGTRTERPIATLPSDTGVTCGFGAGLHAARPHPPYLVSDHLAPADAFAVDADRACFAVVDHAADGLATVAATLEVSLADGRVASSLSMASPASEARGDRCFVLPDEEVQALPCTRLLVESASVDAQPQRGGHRIEAREDGSYVVAPRGRERPLAIEGASLRRISPDGRWGVIFGNVDGGDEVFVTLWLFDVARGVVVPLASARAHEEEVGDVDEDVAGEGDGEVDAPVAPPRARVRPWPAALSARAWTDDARMRAAGLDVPGDVRIAWRGASLVIDDRIVVTPGRSIVILPGTLVR